MRHDPAAKRSRRRPARRPLPAPGRSRRLSARRWRRGSAAVATFAVAALVLAASALAYWTTAGSGTTSATVADAQAVTLTPGTASAELYPGGSADVAVSVSNPNTSPVRVVSLSLDATVGTGGFDVDGAHAGCDPSVLSFATQSNGGAGWTIPAKVGATAGVAALDLPGALAMSAAAASACQGASFIVHLSVGS
jgi:hypothetical protein